MLAGISGSARPLRVVTCLHIAKELRSVVTSTSHGAVISEVVLGVGHLMFLAAGWLRPEILRRDGPPAASLQAAWASRLMG